MRPVTQPSRPTPPKRFRSVPRKRSLLSLEPGRELKRRFAVLRAWACEATPPIVVGGQAKRRYRGLHKNRRRAKLKSGLAEAIGQAVLADAWEPPAPGQVSPSDELRQRGTFVIPRTCARVAAA